MTEPEEMSEVMKILKKRIYYGRTHSTQIADLKQAEKEILDWADKLLLEQEQRLKEKK